MPRIHSSFPNLWSPFCTRTLRIRFDGCAIDAQIFKVYICVQLLKNAQKDPIITQFTKSAVHPLMWIITCRNTCTGGSAPGQPEYDVEHHSVVFWRPDGFGAWDHILDPFSLGVSQFVASRCHMITSMLFLLYLGILCGFYMDSEFSDGP